VPIIFLYATFRHLILIEIYAKLDTSILLTSETNVK